MTEVERFKNQFEEYRIVIKNLESTCDILKNENEKLESKISKNISFNVLREVSETRLNKKDNQIPIVKKEYQLPRPLSTINLSNQEDLGSRNDVATSSQSNDSTQCPRQQINENEDGNQQEIDLFPIIPLPKVKKEGINDDRMVPATQGSETGVVHDSVFINISNHQDPRRTNDIENSSYISDSDEDLDIILPHTQDTAELKSINRIPIKTPKASFSSGSFNSGSSPNLQEKKANSEVITVSSSPPSVEERISAKNEKSNTYRHKKRKLITPKSTFLNSVHENPKFVPSTPSISKNQYTKIQSHVDSFTKIKSKSLNLPFQLNTPETPGNKINNSSKRMISELTPISRNQNSKQNPLKRRKQYIISEDYLKFKIKDLELRNPITKKTWVPEDFMKNPKFEYNDSLPWEPQYSLQDLKNGKIKDKNIERALNFAKRVVSSHNLNVNNNKSLSLESDHDEIDFLNAKSLFEMGTTAYQRRTTHNLSSISGTPPGFWQSDFPNDKELENQKHSYHNEVQRRVVYRLSQAIIGKEKGLWLFKSIDFQNIVERELDEESLL